MRYDTPDENGVTRRTRNENVNLPSPEFEVPTEGLHIYRWYFQLNSLVSRMSEGICKRIPLSEYLAWSKLTGNLVYPSEYDILFAMDETFCIETNEELQNLRDRKEEIQRKELEKSSRRGKGRK